MTHHRTLYTCFSICSYDLRNWYYTQQMADEMDELLAEVTVEED
jgi:hypothetical protein